MALAKGKIIIDHYEKLILGICLIGLVLSAVFVALALTRTPEDPASSRRVAQKMLKPVDVDSLEIESLLTNRVALTNLALISELRVSCTNTICMKLIKEKAKVCSFCGVSQPDPAKRDSDKDGMTDFYEMAHGLDPLNPADYYEDLDDDGYTNGEEFEAGTKPNDPLSHSSYIEKVCIYKTKNRPLKFRFQGAQRIDDTGANMVFQLNLRTLDRTFFARMNEAVEGYKVIKYIPRVVTNENGFVRDVSVIHLDDGDEVLKMQLGKIVDMNRVTARLLNVLDLEQALVIKPDAEFSLKAQNFKVVKLSPGEALVVNSETGEEFTIGKCTSELLQEARSRKEGMRPEEGMEQYDGFPPPTMYPPGATPRMPPGSGRISNPGPRGTLRPGAGYQPRYIRDPATGETILVPP